MLEDIPLLALMASEGWHGQLRLVDGEPDLEIFINDQDWELT